MAEFIFDPIKAAKDQLKRCATEFNIDLDTAYSRIKNGFYYMDQSGVQRYVEPAKDKNTLAWYEKAYDELTFDCDNINPNSYENTGHPHQNQ